MSARSSFTPYATRTQIIHLVPRRCIAEETGDYQQDGRDSATRTMNRPRYGAARRIEIDALRRTADVQIGRLLRLANLLDELDAEQLQAESSQATAGIRDATTLLEQYLHSLADALEESEDS